MSRLDADQKWILDAIIKKNYLEKKIVKSKKNCQESVCCFSDKNSWTVLFLKNITKKIKIKIVIIIINNIYYI